MSSSIGDVAIIGGGIAGVTLALFLHKHGISSTIYEKRSMHDTETGSLAIAANALRVLDHVGIYKRIRSLGHVNDGPELRNTKGATLGSLALGSEELYGYPSVRTYRNTLWKELLREALEARIDIRFGWIFNEIEREDSESVVVRFVNGERVTAGIVVGADGVHSKLRAYLHPGTNAQYGGQTVVMAFGIRKDMEIRSDEGEDEDIPKQLAIFGESGSFFILTTDSAAEEVLFFSTLEVPDRSREEWESFEADKKGLADMLRTRFTTSEWPSAVHSLLKNTSEEKYTCWPLRYVPKLPSTLTNHGRLILIGDAAHAIPPSVGQSGAMALEDAETLAETLKFYAANSSGQTLKQLLQGWERSRSDRIAQVIERTKAGSELRKAAVDATKKEKDISEWSEKDKKLNWLYGYDAGDFDHVLMSDRK